ncbi:MAG: DUF484 family protein [Candidatus Eutrophobiaceae bacterium]
MNESENILTEEQIDEWLRAHPDFFERHADLLACLSVPHESGGVLSLVERQISVLRSQLRKSERQLREFLAIANQNQSLQNQVHQLILELLIINNALEFFQHLYQRLRIDFQADCVTLRLFATPTESKLACAEEFDEPDGEACQYYKELFSEKQSQIGHLHAGQAEYLFPKSSNPEITSAALLRLSGVFPALDGEGNDAAAWLGVLAIGSTDITRFHSGMGTELLSHFASILSVLVQNWIVKD